MGFPINPPREAITEADGRTVSGPWYRFFAAIQKLIGGATNPFDDALFSVPPAHLPQADGEDALLVPPPLRPEVQAILDQLSRTQGDIIYRGASGWAVLAASTSGFVLKTLGVGANPAWAAGYSNEDAQDAVGGILTDTSTIDFTYNDGANTITADVKAGSIGATELASTAVTPGSYTLASITVDADGRITAASSGSGGTATLADGDYGDITASSSGTVLTIDTDVVSDTKLRDSAALSVIGRSANSSGDPADIAAGSDGQVLRRSGTSLGFGAVDLASANAVTGALPIANQASQAGRLIGRQVFTSGSGTYTPTGGTTSIVIEAVGGGAGGGGAAQAGSGNVAIGQGGGGGAYLSKRLTADFSGGSYAVGSAGTGGSAGNNAGNNGGDTTFTDTAGSPTVYTAAGGTGGSGQAGVSSPTFRTTAAGGAATNGDENVTGGRSNQGISINSGTSMSGRGGTSMRSAGGTGASNSSSNSSTAGSNATGYGGGGSGGVSNGTGAAVAGGDGAAGLLIIWEYS